MKILTAYDTKNIYGYGITIYIDNEGTSTLAIDGTCTLTDKDMAGNTITFTNQMLFKDNKPVTDVFTPAGIIQGDIHISGKNSGNGTAFYTFTEQ